MMKDALEVVADDLPLGQVHAEVRTIRTHHRGLAVLAAKHDDPATEKLPADDLPVPQLL